MATIKVKFPQLAVFLQDPAQIGHNQDQDFAELRKCFLIMQPRVAAIVTAHKTPIDEAYKKEIEAIMDKYCTSAFEMPYTNERGEQQMQLQFQYNYKDLVKARDERSKAAEVAQAAYTKLGELEVEIEPEICFTPNMPPFQKFPVDKQKPYEGLIITHKLTPEEIKAEESKPRPTPTMKVHKGGKKSK